MKCIKCGSEMKEAVITAAAGGKLCAANPDNKTKLGGMKTTDIKGAVCPDCGYTELYAADPLVFAGKNE